MIPEASHRISVLTANVSVTKKEADLWTKLMKQAVNLKIKLTKRSLTTLLLLKLRSRNMGTNEAEEYAAHDIAKERGRKRNIRSVMKQKIAMAKANEVRVRKEYRKKIDYVEKRMGRL